MDKLKQLFFEFARYIIIGGLAFLVDSGILMLFNELLLPELYGYRLYVSTALGFMAGLAFNYIFSILFVFKSARTSNAGRSAKAFALFAVIGIVGLILTELGMYAGAELLKLHYILVKIVVAGIVLIWNYLGRKIFIFK